MIVCSETSGCGRPNCASTKLRIAYSSDLFRSLAPELLRTSGCWSVRIGDRRFVVRERGDPSAIGGPSLAIFTISMLQDEQDQEAPRAETHYKDHRNCD
jgi:hypothetical protein